MKENLETYALAGVGVVKGACELFRELPVGDRAWIGLLGSVAVYEACAPPKQLLSESMDRMIAKHPIATRAVIGYTALHLANLLPPKIDIFHQLTNKD